MKYSSRDRLVGQLLAVVASVSMFAITNSIACAAAWAVFGLLVTSLTRRRWMLLPLWLLSTPAQHAVAGLIVFAATWTVAERVVNRIRHRELEAPSAHAPAAIAKPAGRPAAPRPGGQRYGNFTVYGRAGAGLETSGFGAAQVKAGMIGEQSTVDRLVQALAELPFQTVLVNSVRYAGSRNADVDHVLIVGSKAWLIDSKNWAKGSYTMVSPNQISFTARDRSGSPTAAPQIREVHMDDAVRNQRRDMPRGTTVAGAFVVIHPYHTDSQWLTSGLRSKGFSVKHACAGDVCIGTVDDLVAMIRAQTRPGPVNQNLVDFMCARMKEDPRIDQA